MIVIGVLLALVVLPAIASLAALCALRQARLAAETATAVLGTAVAIQAAITAAHFSRIADGVSIANAEIQALRAQVDAALTTSAESKRIA